MNFTHLDKKGNAVMVDVSSKPMVRRTAKAYGKIELQEETVRMIREKLLKKGDVLTTAKIAAISGAKETAHLIPLCHNICIDHVEIDFTLEDKAVEIRAGAVCTGKTGIEMETLTAVSIAALTIYDMCKAVDDTMKITEIRLLEKTKEDIRE